MARPKKSESIGVRFAPDKFLYDNNVTCFKRQDEHFIELGYAIVQQAVEDWRYIAATTDEQDYTPPGTAWTVPTSISILRNFFKNAWCDSLLFGMSISGADILEQLEKELAAMSEERERKKNARLQEIQRNRRNYQHGNG